MLGLAASAQSTHFSQTVGLNNTLTGANSGFGSVRTASGNFTTVAVSQAGGFEIRSFNNAGTMLLTTKVASSVCTIEQIAFVTEAEPNAILVTGTGNNGASPVFYVAKINLLTNDVTITTRVNESFSYTKGPRAVANSTGIVVAYPQYGDVDLNKYDMNLNPIWAKRCEVDTLTGKNPGNDCGILDDSTIIVVGKCDSILGYGDYDDNDGELDSMRLFQIGGYTRIYGMGKAADGSMLLAGLNMSYTGMGSSTPILIKVDATGNIVWAKKLDASLASPVFGRFVDVEELPNGNLVAFATTFDAYNDTFFNGVCTFDSNGNLLNSLAFGSTYSGSGIYYQLYDVKIYADGILMTGVTTDYDNGSVVKNQMIFSDFNFNSVCDKATVTLTNEPLVYGKSRVLSKDDVRFTTNPLTTTASYGLLTMSSNTTTETCSISTSINEVEQNATSLYPNPVAAGSDLNISLSEAGNYTINVISTTGAIVSTVTLNGTATTINTNNMTTGLYLVNVYTNGKLVNSNKISVR